MCTTGSGLVHMSPANGEDDFEVSQRRKIPVFNPIDGQAVFNQDAGAFSGLFVRDADQKVSDALKQAGALLRYGRLKHEYPVCWRSGHRLVYLARREYFYFVDRLKEMAVDATGKIEYYYDQPKNRFVEIVKEKRPWCISRERVWGTPLPIWKCEKCGKKLGLFSRKEIVAKAKSLPDGEDFELHRPGSTGCDSLLFVRDRDEARTVCVGHLAQQRSCAVSQPTQTRNTMSTSRCLISLKESTKRADGRTACSSKT